MNKEFEKYYGKYDIHDLVDEFNSVLPTMRQLIKYSEFKTILVEVAKQKKLKDNLKKAMEEYGIKKWTTPNDTKITLVADGEDKEIEVFNEDNFKKDNEELYKKYTETKIKKGRAGYVKITLKEE